MLRLGVPGWEEPSEPSLLMALEPWRVWSGTGTGTCPWSTLMVRSSTQPGETCSMTQGEDATTKSPSNILSHRQPVFSSQPVYSFSGLDVLNHTTWWVSCVFFFLGGGVDSAGWSHLITGQPSLYGTVRDKNGEFLMLQTCPLLVLAMNGAVTLR